MGAELQDSVTEVVERRKRTDRHGNEGCDREIRRRRRSADEFGRRWREWYKPEFRLRAGGDAMQRKREQERTPRPTP